jgi:hypothetical protein
MGCVIGGQRSVMIVRNRRVSERDFVQFLFHCTHSSYTYSSCLAHPIHPIDMHLSSPYTLILLSLPQTDPKPNFSSRISIQVTHSCHQDSISLQSLWYSSTCCYNTSSPRMFFESCDTRSTRDIKSKRVVHEISNTSNSDIDTQIIA